MAIIVLALIVPVINSGMLARPGNLGFPDWQVTWPYIIPRILDLENQGAQVTRLSANWLWILTFLCLASWAAVIAVAIFVRNICDLAFTLGPALLLMLLFAVGAGATSFQMIGYFYPAALCGTAALSALATRNYRVVPISSSDWSA
jgi:hypothetical protein